MSQAKIIKELKKKYPELNYQEIKLVVDCFSKTIGEALIKGKRIELRDFGTFFVKKLKARLNARNPRTGKEIYVPEKTFRGLLSSVPYSTKQYLNAEILINPKA